LEVENILPFVKPFYDAGLCPKAPQHFSEEVLGKFFLDKKSERANKILQYADFAHKVKVMW
jgi:hypothetical protein